MSDRRASLPRLAVAAATVILSTSWIAAPQASAQEAVVLTDENFRAEPNGTILGRLEQGTRLTIVEQDGSWARATLEGFVWTASMQLRDEDGFDLIITEGDGENIRDEPSGRIAGRLGTGTRLEELERIPGWVRVRRTGWIWVPSIDILVAEAAEPSRAEEELDADAPEAGAPSIDTTEWLRIGDAEVEVRAEPDGDPVALAIPPADVRVLSEEGNWVRVRLEGWVWRPDLEGAAEPDEAAVLRGVDAAALRSDPAAYRGRVVEMELQFVSLESAEQVRTDFYQGEPFLLTRSLGGERSFVYVAVPPERRDEMVTLVPLETIRVLGRVRAGAAAFTGNPIVDLLEVERVR